ncbi:MAG: ribonuclease Y [Gemmatimonadetes bacterium]|nr:ribonuclease Y [Gemmatimonadota bacterium]
MYSLLNILLVATVGLMAGLIGYTFYGMKERSRQKRAQTDAGDEASRILSSAEKEAENLRTTAVLNGKEEVLELREAWKEEEQRHRQTIAETEKRLAERSSGLDSRFNTLNKKESQQDSRERDLSDLNNKLLEEQENLSLRTAEIRAKLESIGNLSVTEAKEQILEELRSEARAEAANLLREIKEEAEKSAEKEAKKILALAIQRMAADETADMTVSVVQLPSDEMKGRIIGREGRNIRAFEQATGIDLLIDDTPEAVVLSGYDPVRREVARFALESLVEDGRIHPARIEEVVKKSMKEVDKTMVEAAEEVLYELGIHNVHAQIVKVLGRLKFRTSYGQNQLRHSKEVARLAGSMATEMGLNVEEAKRAGLLHDVGKGLTHDQEGSHVELGYRICKKYNESEIVLNSIKAHHGEEPHNYPETFLVTAADAISGSRPGARREMFEGYVKRLEKLEELAMETEGVERCFAIQAGREIRVMVEPDKVKDAEMDELSQVVAGKIEDELQYPGQIKVVVIRETRSVGIAK